MTNMADILGLPCDKVLFPSYEEDLNEWRESTIFWQDFTIADKFGFAAVKDTWKRAFSSWKDDVKYLVELCVVMNQKCWRLYDEAETMKEKAEKGGSFKGMNAERVYDYLMKLSAYYGDCFHEAYDYAFRDDTAFSKEERSMFFRVID